MQTYSLQSSQDVELVEVGVAVVQWRKQTSDTPASEARKQPDCKAESCRISRQSRRMV